MPTFKYGPSKGQVQYAVQTEGLPPLLQEALSSLSLTVFEGGQAVVACRLVCSGWLPEELETITRIPGVLADGEKLYYAARREAGSPGFEPFLSIEEWEGYAPSEERAYYAAPCGSTTHWAQHDHVQVWRV